MNNKLLTIITVCMIMITVKLYIPDAEAKIDGKSWSQLQLDFDFKKAVENIVERCEVENNSINC